MRIVTAATLASLFLLAATARSEACGAYGPRLDKDVLTALSTNPTQSRQGWQRILDRGPMAIPAVQKVRDHYKKTYDMRLRYVRHLQLAETRLSDEQKQKEIARVTRILRWYETEIHVLDLMLFRLNGNKLAHQPGN